jgi:hypothetical protein
MKLYAVTIIYNHTDGHEAEAVALVGADDASEAISTAASAIAELPHCAKLIGGDCEELPETLAELNAQEVPLTRETPAPAQGRYRPPGITVH